MRALAAAGLLFVSSAFAADALFPTPLHLTKTIDDPLTRQSYTVEQYCAGDKVITIHERRVAIEDFAAQTLTEIDHARLTYSVTRFEDIAKAQFATPAAVAPKKHDIAVNRGVTLSRAALEALIGASFPNRRAPEHDDVIRAAGGASRSGRIAAQSAAAETFALPSEETITYENGLTGHNKVVQINSDLPPAAALMIDPGASRVESRLTRLRRELEELDKLPSPRR